MKIDIFTKNIIFEDFINNNIKNKFLDLHEANLVDGIWFQNSKIYSFNNSYIFVKNFKDNDKNIIFKSNNKSINFFKYKCNYRGFKYNLGLLELEVDKNNEFISK